MHNIIDNPSNEAKEKLVKAFNIQARSELFVNKLYHDEYEVISEYLNLKNKQLQVLKEEKLKLEKNIRKTNDVKIDNLRNELFKIKF